MPPERVSSSDSLVGRTKRTMTDEISVKKKHPTTRDGQFVFQLQHNSYDLPL